MTGMLRTKSSRMTHTSLEQTVNVGRAQSGRAVLPATPLVTAPGHLGLWGSGGGGWRCWSMDSRHLPSCVGPSPATLFHRKATLKSWKSTLDLHTCKSHGFNHFDHVFIDKQVYMLKASH